MTLEPGNLTDAPRQLWAPLLPQKPEGKPRFWFWFKIWQLSKSCQLWFWICWV